MRAKPGPGMKVRDLECRQWKLVTWGVLVVWIEWIEWVMRVCLKHFGMCHVGAGKKCGVVEEVKRQTLKWFGHMEWMEKGKMTRRMYIQRKGMLEEDLQWNGGIGCRSMSVWGVKDPWEILSSQGGSVRIERDGSYSDMAIPKWKSLRAGVKMNRIE